MLRAHATHVHGTYVDAHGTRFLKCLSHKDRARVSTAVGATCKPAPKSSPKSAAKSAAGAAPSLRHLFDGTVTAMTASYRWYSRRRTGRTTHAQVAAVVSHLETELLPAFLASVHYHYVLALKAIMM